jgi:metal-responsive CopG/Arc/MetJ family transcriptional regulator
MAVNNYSNFLVRINPKSRALLDAAAKDKEMPRAHIINNALKSYLKEYNNSSINERLNALKL